MYIFRYTVEVSSIIEKIELLLPGSIQLNTMSRESKDKSNIRMARAEARYEEEYWRTIYLAEDYWENVPQLKCSFCKQLGHLVFYKGEVTCQSLRENKCKSCGEKGHTPKYCKK